MLYTKPFKVRKTAALIAFLFFIQSVDGQEARKYSNEFLAIGVGARALGMSNAYVTSVNDVTAGYWNPAGLLGVKSNMQIALMHSEYFAGIAKYDYGGFATPIDSASALGFSMIRFGVDDIPNTIDLIDEEGFINYDRISSFSAADYAFLISYAKKLKVEGLRIGGNAKVIHRRVGEFARAWGFGLDIGAQFDYQGWKFGAMGRDITSTFNAWSFNLDDRMKEVFSATGNEIPANSVEVTLPRLILGVAKDMKINNNFNLLSEFNADVTFDGKRNVLIKGKPVSADPHLGVEVGFRQLIFLRMGVGNFQWIKSELGNREVITFQPNIGVGVKIKSLTIDYALTDLGDQSVALYSNVFSLKLDINKVKK